MSNDERILEILVQLQSDMKEVMADVSGLKGDVSALKADVSGIKTRLDVDITKQLNLLAEGHQSLVERLDVLDEVKELSEDTKATVDVMYSVVSKHSIDINKLKAKVGLTTPNPTALSDLPQPKRECRLCGGGSLIPGR